MISVLYFYSQEDIDSIVNNSTAYSEDESEDSLEEEMCTQLCEMLYLKYLFVNFDQGNLKYKPNIFPFVMCYKQKYYCK